MLELADEFGYRGLPASDAESLGTWFRQAADSGSLVQYLETFAHTVGVMQQPDAIHRVARECALDLAADGVVYAEVRFAPELATARGSPSRTSSRRWSTASPRAAGRRPRPAPRSGSARCCARCGRTTAGRRSPGW